MDATDQAGHNHWRLVDPHRTACLCDVGAPGYIATVAVAPDGGESLWLADTELLDHDADLGNPNQRHEKLGRLPQPIRDRIWGDALRCGRPRSNGQPCRQRVAEPGHACSDHSGPDGGPALWRRPP